MERKVGENKIASFYVVYDQGALYAADEDGNSQKYDAATANSYINQNKNKFSAGSVSVKD